MRSSRPSEARVSDSKGRMGKLERRTKGSSRLREAEGQFGAASNAPRPDIKLSARYTA